MPPGKRCADESNHIRITSSGSEKSYVEYALKLLAGENKDPDGTGVGSTSRQNPLHVSAPSGAKTVIFWSSGTAMTKCVSVCEIVKRVHPGLHQWTRISSIEQQLQSEQSGDPTTELKSSQTRKVAELSILLSTLSTAGEGATADGYQGPMEAGRDIVCQVGKENKGGKDAMILDPSGGKNQISKTQERTTLAAVLGTESAELEDVRKKKKKNKKKKPSA